VFSYIVPRPDKLRFQVPKNAVGFSSAAALLRAHHEIKFTANSCIALFRSTNAVSISSTRTFAPEHHRLRHSPIANRLS
jgi:hypothetical protein